MATKLYPFQKEGVRQIDEFDGRVLLADEMGLGKTIQALTWLKKHPNIRPVVIVCPAPLKWNWEREAKVHTGLHTEVLNGTKVPLRGGLASCKIIILNYDIIGAWLPWLLKLKPKVVILDEGHFVKNPRAKRSKYCRKLCAKAKHVLILSGTPLTNRPSELWPILHMVRPDLYPNDSWPAYAQRYCKPRMTRYGWDFSGATRLPELHGILKKWMMIRRKKRNVLKQLPKKSRHIVPIEIRDRKQYELARKNLIQWVAMNYGMGRARKAKRSEALMRVMYLKRLTAKLKFREVIKWIENFLEETDEKLFVVVIHKVAVRTLKKKFPNSVVVDGSINAKKKQKAIDQFQTNPDTRLLIGNMQAAGVGITLTAASTGIIAEPGWTPGEHLQVEARLDRIGQKKPVNWYWLVAKDTIEERICEIIQKKQVILEAVLDGEDAGRDLQIFDQLISEIQKGKIK